MSGLAGCCSRAFNSDSDQICMLIDTSRHGRLICIFLNLAGKLAGWQAGRLAGRQAGRLTRYAPSTGLYAEHSWTTAVRVSLGGA